MKTGLWLRYINLLLHHSFMKSFLREEKTPTDTQMKDLQLKIY